MILRVLAVLLLITGCLWLRIAYGWGAFLPTLAVAIGTLLASDTWEDP